MSDGRFTGQQGSLVLQDITTGDAILPDVHIESWTFAVEIELTEKAFIGEVGPTFREFAKGYSLELKVEYNDAAQVVAWINAMQARLSGASSDEIASSLKYTSRDGQAFRVTCRDLHIESNPFELGGQTEFLSGTIKFKGNQYAVALALSPPYRRRLSWAAGVSLLRIESYVSRNR